MKKADWMLVLCILLAAGAIALWAALDKDADKDNISKSVVVTVDGEIYQRLSLFENQEIDIPTKDGDSVLVISDNACYMKSAHCPDQICVKHRQIQAVGESIICLPYKIVVTIEGSEEAAYDN